MRGRLTTWYVVSVGSLAMGPFLAVRLTDAGLSDSQATAALLLMPLGTLFGGPFWGWIADRTGRGGPLLIAAAAGTTLAAAGLSLPIAAGPLIGVLLLFALLKAPLFPLVDALAVGALGRDYGRVRAWGSLAFGAVALTSGLLRDTWALAPMVVGTLLLAATTAASARLPAPPRPEARPPLRALLRAPGLPLLLAVAFCNGLTLTAYDNLFPLHVEREGLPSAVAGFAVAWGVTVEVVVLLLGPRLLSALGPWRLLVLGTAAGIPRWLLTASSPTALVAAQGLHGVQFGAFWLGSVALIAESAPVGLRRSAQALLPAAMFGAATLVSLGASALWLQHGTTRQLFAALLVPSTIATLGALWGARKSP